MSDFGVEDARLVTLCKNIQEQQADNANNFPRGSWETKVQVDR